MPLNHGYGVIIGSLHSYYRNPVNDYGQYYHGNVEVQTPAGRYKCAIDVDMLPPHVGNRSCEATSIRSVTASLRHMGSLTG